MYKSILVTAVAIEAIVSLVVCAYADGIMVPDENAWKIMRERAYINEPEQKAVVFFSEGQEQLIISPSYEGSASNFAWVIPVPSKPKVEILKGAIFHELAKLVAPKPLVVRSADKVMSAQTVNVIERKTVGAYDVSVLAAADGKALARWLKANKYHLPTQALEPIQGYVKKHWIFVACRIKVPAQSAGLRSGTLAPLRLSFPTKLPVYPMKISFANPKPFSALIYVVLPVKDFGRGRSTIVTASAPAMSSSQELISSITVKPWPWKLPTLDKISHDELRIFLVRRYLKPEECTEDFVWAFSP